MGEVFVTASRHEQALELVNASVQVITAETMRTFSGRSLTEVLQFATGVLARDSGSSSSLSLRGQDSDKTLILVDGLRRTEKYAGANLNNIQLEDVERIEIVRGPMSALYGSEAIGGVINIITRGPAKGRQVGVRAMAGQADGGQRDTLVLGGFGNWGDGDLGHRLSVELKRREPFRLASSDPRITDINRERRDFLSYRGDVRTAAGHFDWGMELARQDDDGTGLGRTGDPYQKIEHERRDFLNGGFRGRVGRGELSLRLGYGESDASVNRGTTQNELTLLKQAQAEGQYAFEAFRDHLTTAGYAYRRDDADISTNSRRAIRDVNALFVQNAWSFRPDADLTLGLRHDDYSDFGSKAAPRLALAWRPERWTLRAGLGKGFKAPSLLNLYMTSILRGRYDLRGNPYLQPEESTSGELAAGYRFDRGRVEVVAHRANVTNLIASVPTGARGPGCGATPTPATSCQIQEYRNVGKAVIQGIEAGGQYRFDQAWRIEGSIEYLNARDGSSDARLTDRPTWSGRLALRWHRERWQADLRLRHTHHWYAADPGILGGVPFTSNYTVAALRLAYGLDTRSELYLGVDNLANRLPPANQTSRGTPDDPGARFVYLGRVPFIPDRYRHL